MIFFLQKTTSELKDLLISQIKQHLIEFVKMDLKRCFKFAQLF